MNRNATLIISATVGGAIGYFVSAVISDYIEEKEIRDLAPVVINEDEEQPNDDDEESTSRDLVMPKKKKSKREKTNYAAYFNSIQRPDLAALAQKYNEGESDPIPSQNGMDVAMIAVDEYENFVKDKAPLDGIVIISQDQFNDNPDDYEIVELTYYADDIIVGEDDNVIYEPEDIIGSDALTSFGMLSGDPDIVYVRNPKTRALYEIVRMSVKYAINADADDIIPRKGLKKNIDFDEVTDEEDNEEVNS